MKIDIKSMNISEIKEYLKNINEPLFRANQIFKWLHKPVNSFSEMTNIPKDLRKKLEEDCIIYNVIPEKRLVSKIDGTVKYLFRLSDGEFIETVFMKYKHGHTVCISTQVGCRMGCSFCASGILGLARNLTASEMLSQIEFAGQDNKVRISNVVMMGMGEPLDNFKNSVRFLELVTNPEGLGIGLRHISLSTSGVVPKIYELAKLNLPITLSVSLHAPNNQIRNNIMKVNKSWPIEELIKACQHYQNTTKRRISFEYALIGGVNDSLDCAKELVLRLKGIMSHVNLIPANPVKENNFVKSNDSTVKKFADYINANGITATVRRTLGADINASCGQLRRNNSTKEVT